MLGRLEMDVDQCITEYISMIRDIFKKKSLPVNWRGKVKGRFDTKILEDSLKKTISKISRNESELLENSKDEACKV